MVFPNNFESLEVVIKDIKNPDYSLNTSPIEIILTNQDNSSIFTTFSNLDNFAFKKYENQNDIKESLLKYYKGRGFSYDTNLSLIQVKDNENPNVYNEISISQGSYKKFVFIKDKILNKGSLENTKISLNSDYPFIKSYDSSYLFEIYSMKSVEFQLATKCNLSNGKYIIKFNSSNPNYPISLVQLNVVRKEKIK